MTRMRTGSVSQSLPHADPVEIVRWHRGSAPFQVVLQNFGQQVFIKGSPDDEGGFFLPVRTQPPYPQLVIDVPAAERGQGSEEEAVYFQAQAAEGLAWVNYLVQPTAGDTAPVTETPSRFDAGLLAQLTGEAHHG